VVHPKRVTYLRLRPLPLEARHELMLQGLEQQRTPEAQATYLLIELLRRAAGRRASAHGTRQPDQTADGAPVK
jgi:hypothetical protein